MASGTTALLWYLLCGGFVVFTVGVAFGLFKLGERRRQKRLREQEKSSS